MILDDLTAAAKDVLKKKKKSTALSWKRMAYDICRQQYCK